MEVDGLSPRGSARASKPCSLLSSAKGCPSPTALPGPLILLWVGTFQGQLLEYCKELSEVLGGEVGWLMGPAQSQVQDLQAGVVRVWDL